MDSPLPPNPKRQSFLSSLGFKNQILFVSIVTAVVSIVLISSLYLNSIQRFGQTTQDVSQEALIAQAESFLVELTTENALKNELILDAARSDATNVSQYASFLFNNPESFSENSLWSLEDNIFIGSEGQIINGPDDFTTIFVPNNFELNDSLLLDLNTSAYMDSLFETAYLQNPNTVAIYLISKNGLTKLYPNINLPEIVPPEFNALEGIFYTVATPENNPSQATVWTPVYDDPAGQGLLVSAISPIYLSSGEFYGVIGVDFSLNNLAMNIEASEFTGDSYSFLIDSQGRSIALPEEGRQDFFDSDPLDINFGFDLNTAVSQAVPVIEAMKSGETGIETITLNGIEHFIAYSPLASLNWSLATVIEKDAIIQSVAPIQTQLNQQSNSLIWQQLLPLGALITLLSLISAYWLISRATQPLVQLSNAVEKIGEQDWDYELPQTRNDEIGALARTLDSVTFQFRNLLSTLEHRVDTRTHQLRMVNTISEHINTILEPEMLLDEIVNQIKDSFDIYHAQIYLFDDSWDILKLANATGAAGQQMLQNNHVINYWEQKSIVANAAQSKKIFHIDNVSQSDIHLPSPLLPFTRSEIAIPIIHQQELLGVLDLQSESIQTFSEQDYPLFNSLSNQIATAFTNANLFSQKEAQEERLNLLNELALELSTVTSQELAMQTVSSAVSNIIGSDATTFALLNKEKTELTLTSFDSKIKRAGLDEIPVSIESSGIGKAIKNGQLYQFTNARQSQYIDIQNIASLTSTRAIMIAPLIIGSEAVGTLNVSLKQESGYAPEQHQLMQQVSRLLSTTLENLQLLEQTQQNLQEEALVREILLSSSSQTSLDAAFEQICKIMANYYGVPRSGFVLFNEELTFGTVIAEYSESNLPSSVGMQIPVQGNPSNEYIIENKTHLYIENAQIDPLMAPIHDVMKEFGIGSILIIPILNNNQVIGTIGFDTTEIKEFSESEILTGINAASQINQIIQRILVIEALEMSESQFRDTIANLPAPLAVIDLETGYLPYVNEAFYSLFGGTPDQVINVIHARNFYQNAEDRPRILNLLEKNGNVESEEMALKKMDGSIFWAELSMLKINYFGKPSLLTGFYDTTSRKESEQLLLEAKNTAEEANHLKSKFLSNMSHELRTPLNAIINMAGFVLDGMLGDVNEMQIDALEKTVDSGQHLLSLINDILDLTKIEAGLMNIVLAPVDMNNMLESVSATGKGLVKDNNISFITEIEPDLPTISGDKRRIRQIFLNLISNGIKYTREGEVRLKAYANDDGIYISVTDTGIGIPKEDFELIFTEFGQAKNMLGNVASTGLGLPITKQLVEMHGGRIWFESEINKGSVFSLFLPLKAPVVPTAIVLEQGA